MSGPDFHRYGDAAEGGMAEVLCRQDDTLFHHDRTDDFPCTFCKEKADALAAAGYGNLEDVPLPHEGGSMSTPEERAEWRRDAERGYAYPSIVRALLDELEKAEAERDEARGDSPSGFMSQREWEDWSNDLAMLIPEDLACGNPEGAQESIIEDTLRHLVRSVQVVKTADVLADLKALAASWEPLTGGWEYGTALLALIAKHETGGIVTPDEEIEEVDPWDWGR